MRGGLVARIVEARRTLKALGEAAKTLDGRLKTLEAEQGRSALS